MESPKQPQQQPKEQGKPSAVEKLMKEQWKTEEDYKRMIVALELQNQKYRNELYELGQTVNKILQKTKLPQTNKAHTPNLDQQLQLTKKQLHNVNQFIEIYQRQLNGDSGKKKGEQIQSIADTQQLLKSKSEELNVLKKEVKDMQHKNKALEYKLLEFNKRNRARSIDQQALQLKELINENKNLKNKLQSLEQMQQKRQGWLRNNLENAKSLQQKIHTQETRLPKIERKHESRSTASLPKLQSEKKIYSKWLESNRQRSNTKLERELNDLEKINRMVQQKIKNTSRQISEIEQEITKSKKKVEENEIDFSNEAVDERSMKRRDMGVMVSKKPRKARRDWVGKFDTLRFSDSRTVRDESRVYKIMFNSAGYFQFNYYSVKDHNNKTHGKFPFDATSLSVSGKQSTFTVEYPDFIKNIRVKINLKTQKITEMHVVSNIGLQSQFICDSIIPPKQSEKGGKKDKKEVSKEQQVEVIYEMDVKANEAITTIFGSYGYKTDDKKNITSIWLQGLGVELIQDFVEQLI